MKLIQCLRLSLALATILTATPWHASASDDTSSCVVLSEFYGEVSAQSTEWQRARLESLANPDTPCDELKLGLLLSHPVVAFQNDAKALDALSHALLLLPDEAVDKAMLSMTIDHIEERQTLRNMLGKSQRQLRYRQLQINTLRGQIDQLKNLEAQLEDKARAAIEPEPENPDTGEQPTANTTTDEIAPQETQSE